MEKNIFKKNFIINIIKKDLFYKKYKKIKTRFPPEPNGYLHIGHVKSLFLNYYISKHYNGIFNLRFDDTNPVYENIKYIKSIKQNIKWLGINVNNIYYTSNYFNQIYDYAIELIIKKLAYVEKLSKKKIKKYKGNLTNLGKNSPYRNKSVIKNLNIFKKMKKGYFSEGTMCLRAKINMYSPNIIMRDPILYRIKYISHYRTIKKWCIYPTYDFSHCISDAIEKISHSLCTLEFTKNRILYNWILKNLTISFNPCQYEFSKLNLTFSILSKKKLNFLVNNKIVNGWNDPRMPTLSAYKKKGYTAKSILSFCKNIGISKKENIIDIMMLESYVRNDLNINALRVMGVLNPLTIIIKNMGIQTEMILIQLHPKKKNLGFRIVPFSRKIYIDKYDFKEKFDKKYKRLILGKKIKLRNSYIIKAKKINKNICGIIKTIYCNYYLNITNQKKNNYKLKNIIHWVSKKHSILVFIYLYNNLFKTPNPLKYKNLITIINPFSLIIKNSYIEPSLFYSQNKKTYQFERIGYFYLNNYNYKNNLIFNRIITLKQNKFKKNN
ncbi:MAG: glutamine--tRNA ligase [Enterobacteriaceae bacterium Cmel21]|nr:glutamine--tRNA ligase [Enterobacteriaceae bacterium Cmel17]WMC17483.1 MAG: glutamine--tRNA ligase [Enterobacteriaceae bacterium Cmel21]